MNKIH